MRSESFLPLTCKSLILLASVAVLASQCRAGQLDVDFEAFADGVVLSNQVPGLSFNNLTVLTTSGSLNGAEFPPQSGVAAGFDSGGPVTMTINLAALGALEVTGISGYFTYVTPLLVEIFGPGNVLLGSTNSLFSSNFVSSGNPPSELIGLVGADIRSMKITGQPAGESFVVDDLSLTFTPASETVPEPGAALGVLAGLALLGLRQGIRKQARE